MCLVDEHSWCFISEIGAICAVIYGVLAFTPPLTDLYNTQQILEPRARNQE